MTGCQLTVPDEADNWGEDGSAVLKLISGERRHPSYLSLPDLAGPPTDIQPDYDTDLEVMSLHSVNVIDTDESDGPTHRCKNRLLISFIFLPILDNTYQQPTIDKLN